MRALRTVQTALCLAIGLAATSSCGPDDLTCDYLADPSNCWARTAVEMSDCLPSMGAIGTLSADRASCDFAGGAVVRFDEPLPLSIDDLERLAFTIEKDGADCARFVDTFQNRIEIAAGSESAVAQLRGSFELQCGDGSDYAAPFDSLFECQAGTQPTDGFDLEADTFWFSIWSVSTPGELFRCTVP